MKYILTAFLASTFFISFGQTNHKRSLNNDTSYIVVPLTSGFCKKTLKVEVGEKVSIYLSEDSIVNGAKEYLSNDFVKKDYIHIIAFFDSASSKLDTVSVGFNDFPMLKHLISQQLQKGSAKVFYKRQHVFVDTISHRFERFGGNGDRFFYLPDRRPFFGVTEITGIIDNDALLSGKYYTDYIKEGEKLASLRVE